MPACFCDSLHTHCDRSKCEKAGRNGSRKTTLGQLGKNDCQNCKVLREGLLLPEIASVWRRLGWQGSPDEDRLQVEWTPGTPDEEGRAIIRTVGSSDGAHWGHFIFSLEAGRSDSDTCVGFRKLPKFPLPYTGSPEALSWLRACLRLCNSSHDCLPRDAPLLPSRVVAIHGDHITVEQGAGRRAFYTTLSHCWGGESPLTLTTDNAASLATTGVPLLHLPPTFRDAIAITGQLDRSINYIWIDCMCILQNNLANWRSEAAQMMNVYGNSYLNIAAKHAANAYEGCFAYVKEEPPHKSFPIASSDVLVREVPRPTHHDHSVNHRDTQRRPAPLLKRGWVLQERLLASRVVYFDRHELLWECEQHRECQCSAMIVMTGFKEYWAASLRSGERSAFSKEHPIAAWTKVLYKYTAMQLKFESDRLTALEGVVGKLRTLGVGGDYIAGMWTNRLERQISWFLTDTFEAAEGHVAPSWSWASKRGAVFCSEMSNWRMGPWPSSGAAQILSVSPFDRDDPISGVLQVRSSGVDITAKVVKSPPTSSPPTYRLTTSNAGRHIGDARGDLKDIDKAVNHEQPLVLLWWGHIYIPTSVAMFILIRPASVDGFHERFGLFQFAYHPNNRGQAAFLASLLDNRQESTFKII